MLHRLRIHFQSASVRSEQRRRRRDLPRAEPLESRALLANILDLGLTYTIANAGITSVTGVNSSDEVAGQYGPPPFSSSSSEAFYEEPNGSPNYIAPLAGYDDSLANAINDNGQVVGYSVAPSGGFDPPEEAFIYSQGTLTPLAGNSSAATSINDSGQVVGYSIGDAFLWSKATAMEDLVTMGLASGLMPADINGSGQIVGSSTHPGLGPSPSTQSFLWNGPGKWVYLPTTGGTGVEATAINDPGTVVGSFTTSSLAGAPIHAFMWGQGETSLHDLGTLNGFTDFYATAINNSDEVVGIATQPNIGIPNNHAFMYENGQMTDLNSLLPANSGWILTSATAINNNGVIVGLGTLNNVGHAYEFLTSSIQPPRNPTTTSLQASVMNSVYGQQVALSATVSPNSGASGTPTGSVTFEDGAIELGTAPLSGGSATLPVSNLPTGTDAITADYNGDTVFSVSSSSTVNVTVQSNGTSVSLSSSASQAAMGQTITFTATVSPLAPGGGPPTGSVTFYDDGTNNVGTATLVGGTATMPINNLPVGVDAITAKYGGDTNFLADTSASLKETINSVTEPPTYGSVTTLAASPLDATFGEPVKLTATVKPAGAVRGTPTGNVTFMDGTTSLGTYLLRNGKATLTISTLPLGTDAIQVIYSGDQQLSASPSNIVDEMIEPSPTRTKATSSRKSSFYGQPVTFTAKVSTTGKAKALPSGSVSFLDGSTILGTVPLSSGRASFHTSLLAAGTHSIRLVYNGTTSFAPSSASLKQRVKQAKPSIPNVSGVRVEYADGQNSGI